MLQEKVGTKKEELLGDGDKRKLQDLAVELARRGIQEEITELKKLEEGGDEFEVTKGKENIIRKLKKLNGDSSGSIGAVKDASGTVRTDMEGIVELLENYWKDIFKSKGCNKKKLKRWLEEE